MLIFQVEKDIEKRRIQQKIVRFWVCCKSMNPIIDKITFKSFKRNWRRGWAKAITRTPFAVTKVIDKEAEKVT
jgi:hypothetical protein